jgi:hypothetical protein
VTLLKPYGFHQLTRKTSTQIGDNDGITGLGYGKIGIGELKGLAAYDPERRKL